MLYEVITGFAPVRFTEPLAPNSIGGKQWITVVRQDPRETFAPLAELVAKDSEELFLDMQLLNPYAEAMRRSFEDAWQTVSMEINEARKDQA